MPTPNYTAQSASTYKATIDENLDNTLIPNTTAGSSDAYTATLGLSALDDGRLYIVKLDRANTTTTPTLNLDSLGAKVIKHVGGGALGIGDLIADGIAIFLYDASTSPQSFVLVSVSQAASVTGFVRGITEYVYGTTGVHDNYLDLASVLASAAWESVGPSSSGADNTWTAMNNIPAGAKWVDLRIYTSITYLSNAVTNAIYARKTGDSTAVSDAIKIAYAYGQERAGNTTCARVPLDSSRRFDLYRQTTASASLVCQVMLVGWGT